MATGPDTKKRFERYLKDGYELDSPKFAKLGSWNHILLQIALCSVYLEKLGTRPELNDTNGTFEWNAYFTAFLTTYGKCFNASHGRLVSMDPNRVFGGDAASRAIHDRIIKLRNNYAGHAGDSGIAFSSMLTREESDKVIVHHLMSIEVVRTEDYSKSLLVIEGYVNKKLNKSLDKISEEMGKKIAFDNLPGFTNPWSDDT